MANNFIDVGKMFGRIKPNKRIKGDDVGQNLYNVANIASGLDVSPTPQNLKNVDSYSDISGRPVKFGEE